jgi:catechol 2,3-dioxygenase-like lactoylglutathione lyase family enzyme
VLMQNHVPHIAAMSQPNFLRAVLVLPVREMKEARTWYADTLGFETVYLHDDPEDDPEGNYAILRREGAEVHLIRDEPPREHSWTTAGSGYLFLLVEGIDALFAQVTGKGIEIRRGIVEEDWGARAFQLTDPSGNLIRIAEHPPS